MNFPAAGTETLQQLVDAERASAGAEQRAAEFWNRRIETDAMTVAGRLLAAAERQEFVRLTLANGNTRSGIVTSIGSDVFVLSQSVPRRASSPLGTEENAHRPSAPGRVCIALDQLATLRVDNQVLVTHDARPTGGSLRDLLGELSEQRAPVRVYVHSGQEEGGELVHCGVDLCVLRTSTRDLVYISIRAIEEVHLSA